MAASDAESKTAARMSGCFGKFFGVADGTRTRDNRNHNPGLYQLSYSHRRDCLLSDVSISEDQDYTRILGRWLVFRTKNFVLPGAWDRFNGGLPTSLPAGLLP